MEKFTSWRDKGTGISPFMPPTTPVLSIGRKLLLVPQTILFLLKLPIIIISAALLKVLPFDTTSLYLSRFLLFLLGVSCTTTVDGIKRTNRKLINANLPSKNDFIIVNYISPLDSLILTSIQPNCVFFIPNSHGKLIEYSNWSFFTTTLKNEAHSKAGPAVNIDKYAGKSTVFVFAEGGASNNKAILPFLDLELPKKNLFKFKIVALKAVPDYFSCPVGEGITSYGFKFIRYFNNVVFKAKVVLIDGNSDIEDLRKGFEKASLRLIGKELNLSSKQKFVDAFKK